jgi:hypothetical protein
MTDESELAKIALERAKVELALKQLEFDQSKQAKFPAYWASPLALALVTGVLGIFATGVANSIQGWENAKLNKNKFESDVSLEREKFESSAILKAIDTQDRDKAAELLVFFVKTKIISDPTGKIAKLENDPGSTPILPTGAFNKPALVPIRCDHASSLRSGSSTATTTIQFSNRAGEAISLFWVNRDGQKEPYGTVPPGSQLQMQTYQGHPWLVENTRGQCLEFFLAGSGDSVATISSLEPK